MLIKIPFAKPFLLEFSRHVFNLKYHEDQSHTKSSIDKLLASKGSIGDLPRTRWMIKSHEDIQGFENLVEKSALALAEPLTLEQSRALHAFSMSVDRQFLQGGVYRASCATFSFWLIKLGITTGNIMGGIQHQIHKPQQQSELKARRAIADVVIYHRINELCVPLGVEIHRMTQEKPFVILKIVSHLTESIENKNIVYHADLDAHELSFAIQKDIWDSHLIPLAFDRLQKSPVFTDEELFSFIPCLIDAKFSKAFYQTLKNQSVDVQARAEQIIILCYGELFVVNSYRKTVIEILDTYPSVFKFSLFGHHHNERAKKTIGAIRASQSIEEIQHILLKQKSILEGRVEDEENTPIVSWNDERWTKQANLKNTTLASEKSTLPLVSGFYKVICDALQMKPYVIEDNGQDRSLCAVM